MSPALPASEPDPRRRRRILTSAAVVLAGAAVVAVAIVLLVGGGDDDPLDAVGRFRASPTVAPPPAATSKPARGRYLVARVERRTQLRARPGGRVLARVGRTTEFDSPRVLAVVRRRGDWLGVIATELRNGQVGWIPADNVKLHRSEWSLHLDISARRLVVRRAGRATRRFRVGVGTASSPTPTGRFSVTDTLRVRDPDSPYGCCVIALNGHQTKGLSDWPGGDRIAIHATAQRSDLGQAVSRGCVRADGAVLRPLLRRIPLGSPVFVRA